MEQRVFGKYILKNLGKINIILGKNGCGKSTLLKEIEKIVAAEKNKDYGTIKYITPERGGVLSYQPHIDSNMQTNPNHLSNTRRKNQNSEFRQQSIVQFKHVETMFLRKLDKSEELRADYENCRFEKYINKINALLDNIVFEPVESNFKITPKNSEEEINSENISSGESELISLGMELLVFEQECLDERENILFLDEPDVHLHPDSQVKLIRFLCQVVEEKKVTIILATHSTPLLGALESYEDARVEFMKSGQTELMFKKISDQHRKILPIFGAHPLSNIFNKTPILLVEGEDDERIWQKAVRSSNKKLRIYPCSTDGIGNMNSYEQDIEQIITCIYDEPKAFSLRDRDDSDSNINNRGVIKRFKLECRTSENLLLTDEVLQTLGVNWDTVKKCIEEWLDDDQNRTHSSYSSMRQFQESNFDRKNFKLKEIRNTLMYIIAGNQSIDWEIAIGKTLGKLISEDKINNTGENSIFNYLGKNLLDTLLC